MSVSWVPTEPVPSPIDTGARVRRAAAAGAATLADSLEPLARRIRSEYQEMPGLSLTRDQARCLWGVDADLCDRVLAYLVETGFLACTSHATYVRIGG